MISLKEAYRLENTYKGLLKRLKWMLNNTSYITESVEIRYKSKVMPNKQDEEVVINTPEYPVDIIVQSAKDVMKMLDELTLAIWEYKRKLPFNIDAVTSINSYRRELAAAFNEMAYTKNSTERGSASAFTVNANGEQVQFIYETELHQTICYDRNIARKNSQSMYLKADEISSEIDEALCARKIDYDVPVDVNLTVEQLVDDLIQGRIKDNK